MGLEMSRMVLFFGFLWNVVMIFCMLVLLLVLECFCLICCLVVVNVVERLFVVWCECLVFVLVIVSRCLFWG